MDKNRRPPIVAGNWKMHGSMEGSGALVEALCAGVGEGGAAEMLLCPPMPYLAAVAEWIDGSPVRVGGQNLCDRAGYGAFTGEVSGAMLRDVGCEFVLVGHSERRTLFGETDAMVAAKFEAAQSAELVPVLCVGESLDEREAGDTEAVVARQVRAVVDRVGIGQLGAAVVAYEPIWAIGTGRTASPGQAQEVHAMIRTLLAAEDATIASGLRILYGGSVKGGNASELFAMEDIDGGLVGGASLDATDFLKIYHAATA